MSFVGIDIGTTGCKAVAFNIHGKMLASAYREYPIHFPHSGWAELDSNSVIRRCHEVIRDVASKVKRQDPITAIAASSQGEAMTPIDKNGLIIDRAMVSFDTRNVAECNILKKDFGISKAYKITGNNLHTMCSFSKLEWLRRHKKKIWKNAHKWLCYQDLFYFSLGVTPTIDFTLAARTMLFDIHKCTWSTPILKRLELKKEQLADLKPSGTNLGKIGPSMASKLGLSPEVVLVAGGHDQCCGLLGSGAAKPGSAMYAIGTVECIAPALKEKILSRDLMANNLCTYHHVVPDLYTTLAYSLTGGNLLKWLRDTLCYEEVQKASKSGDDVYNEIVAASSPSPSSVMILPYFMSTGTPYFDSKAKGAFLGMSLSTTKADIICAVLEAVAFEIKLNISVLQKSGVKIDTFHAIGGGSKNLAWMQLKADILNIPISTMAVSEAACLGAALLAAKGSNLIDSLDTVAVKFAKKIKTLYPRKTKNRHYEKRFQIYKQLYPALKKINNELYDLDE